MCHPLKYRNTIHGMNQLMAVSLQETFRTIVLDHGVVTLSLEARKLTRVQGCGLRKTRGSNSAITTALSLTLLIKQNLLTQ